MTSSAATDAKRFLTADAMLRLSEDLAAQVARADFRPSFLLALWRGGCLTGAVVQEYLEVKQGTTIDHVAARSVSRDRVTGTPLPGGIQIHATGHACAQLTADDRLLIVDDVHDSGLTIEALIAHLQGRLRANMPREVKVAVVFYKPARSKTARVPDFYVEATDDWLVFPHELQGLSKEEMRAHRPHAHALLYGNTL
jgi:hypoxanthine phosphoribosyltransferase